MTITVECECALRGVDLDCDCGPGYQRVLMCDHHPRVNAEVQDSDGFGWCGECAARLRVEALAELGNVELRNHTYLLVPAMTGPLYCTRCLLPTEDEHLQCGSCEYRLCPACNRLELSSRRRVEVSRAA